MINHRDAAETAIKIIAAKQSITDMVFCRYLKQRRIKKNIADKYCHEVVFKFRNKDAKHIAIGLKNSAGGYELRSENFKLSSSPKYVTYITSGKQNCDTKIDVANPNFDASDVLKKGCKNQDENLSIHSSIVSLNDVITKSLQSDLKDIIEDKNQSTRQAKSIAVFEGFFDFLTYQTIHQSQTHLLTDFLILNSLVFFERSLLLIEKHERIHLCLDYDEAGKKCLDITLKRSTKYKGEAVCMMDIKTSTIGS